jgi:hypothetical protein
MRVVILSKFFQISLQVVGVPEECMVKGDTGITDHFQS